MILRHPHPAAARSQWPLRPHSRTLPLPHSHVLTCTPRSHVHTRAHTHVTFTHPRMFTHVCSLTHSCTFTLIHLSHILTVSQAATHICKLTLTMSCICSHTHSQTLTHSCVSYMRLHTDTHTRSSCARPAEEIEPSLRTAPAQGEGFPCPPKGRPPPTSLHTCASRTPSEDSASSQGLQAPSGPQGRLPGSNLVSEAAAASREVSPVGLPHVPWVVVMTGSHSAGT